MQRRTFLSGAAASLGVGLFPWLRLRRPPNLLLITLDDLGFDALGVNGNPLPGITPHLDALAAQGTRFNRGHVVIAVCEPSRSVMMTGRYPHRSGAEGFEPVRADVDTLPEALGRAGWLTGIHGKVNHLQPVAKYQWGDTVWAAKLGEGRDPGRYGEHALRFFRKATAARKPFFLMANVQDPHRPFSGSLAETRSPRAGHYPEPPRHYGAAEVPVPPSLPDLPPVRRELAQYYSSVSRADASAGAVLEALEEAGLAEDTLVVALSDNGFSFPFAKATCYLAGTRTPWIVRWPGHVPAGRVDDVSLLTTLDLAPTLLDAARLPPLGGADGASHLRLLRGRGEGRDALFTVFHETFAQRRYPTRATLDDAYGYLWNPWAGPDAVFDAEADGGLTFKAMVEAGRGSQEIAARVSLWRHRASEELYDLRADPWALRDLAPDPAFAEVLAQRRLRLRSWMADFQDPLLSEYPPPGA